MPTGRGNDEVEGLIDLDHVELTHPRHADAHHLGRLSGNHLHDLLVVVQNGVQRQVHPEHPPHFLHVLAGRVVFEMTEHGPGEGHHGVICVDGLTAGEADNRALHTARVAHELMRLDVPDDDANVRVDEEPVHLHRCSAARGAEVCEVVFVTYVM